MQSQHIVNVMKVLQFVGVRNMAAIPSGEDVAVVPRGEGEVTRVALETGGHQFVAEVKLDGLVDFGEVFQQGKRGREREAFRALGFRGEIQFRKDGVGCDELIAVLQLAATNPESSCAWRRVRAWAVSRDRSSEWWFRCR